MEKGKILKEFLRAVQLRTAGANPLEDIMVSLKDYFPPLRDDLLPTSSTSDIDCVVSDLHRLITAMKIHRNALVPIHQLPDDVLSLIFRYHCFGDNDTDIYTDPRWANIMYVCRRWYDLVVHDGFLWSFINTDGGHLHADLIIGQIRRSGNYPLSIYHSYSKDLGIYPLMLAPEMQRIANLHLNASWSNTTAILNYLFASNLPPLRTLLIKTYCDTDDGPRVIVPDAFLTLPSLRCLILSDVRFTVYLIPQHLVVLDVTCDLNEPPTDIWIFLAFLSRMSNLQILKLQHFVSLTRRDGMPIPMPTINLPKLEEFSLTNSLSSLGIFLRGLQIPARCLLHLSNQTTVAGHTGLISMLILSHLRRRWMTPGVAPLRMLRLEARRDTIRPYDLNIDGFIHTNKKLPDFVQGPNTAGLSMQFFFTRGKYRNRVCKRLFRAVGKTVQVLHVQNLILPTHQLTIGWWKVALLSLPALVEVRLSADFQTMLNFCRVLSNLTRTHHKDFPRLKTIHVTKTTALLLGMLFSDAVVEGNRLSSIKTAESLIALVERLE